VLFQALHLTCGCSLLKRESRFVVRHLSSFHEPSLQICRLKGGFVIWYTLAVAHSVSCSSACSLSHLAWRGKQTKASRIPFVQDKALQHIYMITQAFGCFWSFCFSCY